ncbi:MAG: hypothetical protein AAB038_04775 [Planctomycetota bacterium]
MSNKILEKSQLVDITLFDLGLNHSYSSNASFRNGNKILLPAIM